MSTNTTSRLPAYFLSHGGGPWPYMDGPFRAHFTQLEASLKAIPQELGVKPKAVLMISGHWEERDSFAAMASAKPPMVYDYGGFPAHTYSVVYPAPGDPALAERVRGLIAAAGLPASLDAERGYDHGAFTTMFPMYPDADVPVVQLSMLSNYDPETHLALGRALAPLRDEGVLIVGSGLSYHNLRAFGPGAKSASSQFDAWLQDALLKASPAERSELLRHWSDAPAARQAHPREDHLIPLMVAVGAAESEAATCIYHEPDFMGGVTASSFRFGALPA
ncbi:class III extradiol ring-cleavage dioxygenase [Paucibacter sp. R3-3]|uniref:Class III extradiol ring-cleavage dioxygenase n=1 Tax=Roseateles agri TaxID=3098619 RepID=A0ABU5DGN5_9BURK|nr:class III extradiol ring-cleavage dioxygenase [Paucibacter sp. R3-3]MDY0745451.1 class III extradiol ring-cleavage dioxygenase [Paucibacter sp. R3-3]